MAFPIIDNPSLNILGLQTESKIWYKLHVLLYDLRHFDQSNVSRARLDTIIDPSYIGAPYFNQEEAQKIKAAQVNSENKSLSVLIEQTLKERLNRRMKKRVESGDYRVCAAHDVAPILEKALGIRSKDLERNRVFLDLMSANGLDLQPGVQWSGLGKQQKTFHNTSGKRKGGK